LAYLLLDGSMAIMPLREFRGRFIESEPE